MPHLRPEGTEVLGGPPEIGVLAPATAAHADRQASGGSRERRAARDQRDLRFAGGAADGIAGTFGA
jgi:hypothetical protein